MINFRLLKNVICILFGIIFTITANVSAMTFSQPTKIGSVICPPMGNIEFDNATQSNGIQKNVNGKIHYQLPYEKEGFARFGNKDNTIYFHYTPNIQPSYGNQNKSDSIQVKFGLYGSNIYQVNNDKGVKIYIITNSEAIGGFINYVCIGKNSDGKFVQYFSTDNIRKQYFGNSDWSNIKTGKIPHFEKIYCKGDTIIIEYERFMGKAGSKKEGEFRFKWDDAAQWFGVEQVMY